MGGSSAFPSVDQEDNLRLQRASHYSSLNPRIGLLVLRDLINVGDEVHHRRANGGDEGVDDQLSLAVEQAGAGDDAERRESGGDELAVLLHSDHNFLRVTKTIPPKPES